jgi:hypothetical protein
MSSQAQLAANRANAAKGRGPRTAAGKTRASRNALRHGLAAISRHNLAYFHEIGRIAMAYCEGDTDPLLFEQALIIGESDVILSCLVGERLAAIERMRDPDAIPFSDSKASLARARARFAQAKRAYAQLVKAKQAKAASTSDKGKASISAQKNKETNSTSTDNPAKSNAAATGSTRSVQEPHPPAQRDECDAMCRAAPDLRRLERYERRAASRRNRAIREFIFIKSLREFRLRSEALQTQ